MIKKDQSWSILIMNRHENKSRHDMIEIKRMIWHLHAPTLLFVTSRTNHASNEYSDFCHRSGLMLVPKVNIGKVKLRIKKKIWKAPEEKLGTRISKHQRDGFPKKTFDSQVNSILLCKYYMYIVVQV